MTESVRSYAMSRATQDVTGALLWLEDQGFRLSRSQGGASASFGNVLLVYERDGTKVSVARDRGQWALDIRWEGGSSVDYAVLVAASEVKDYRDYPRTPGELPEQLPPGINWLDTLPTVLDWLASGDRTGAISEAADQKCVRMWPESHKAKDIMRRWRREGRT